MGSSSDIEIVTKPVAVLPPSNGRPGKPRARRIQTNRVRSASSSLAPPAVPPVAPSAAPPIVPPVAHTQEEGGMSRGEREDLTHRTRGFTSNKGKQREITSSPLLVTATTAPTIDVVGTSSASGPTFVLSDDELELQLFFARKPTARKPKAKRGIPSSSIPPESSDSDHTLHSSPASSRQPKQRGRGRPRLDSPARRSHLIQPPPISFESSIAALHATAGTGKRAGKNRKRKVCGESGEDESETERKRLLHGLSSSSSSDDSFDELRGKQKEKLAKVRAKSRSLTPPEAVAQHRLDEVIGNLRENLGPAPEDDDSDSSAMPARSQSQSHPSPQKRPLLNLESRDLEEGGEKVVISVSMVPDPEMQSVVAMRVYSRPMEFPMGSQERFEILTDHIATKRSKLPSEIILTYNDRKIYQFGTPSSLKIYEKASFKGYTTDVWDKIARRKGEAEEERKRALLDVARKEEERSVSPAVGREGDKVPQSDLADAPDDPSSSAAAPSNSIKLTLRGSQTDILPLLVRPTMKISSLLKQYCKAFNVPLEKREGMWIEFDGEKLESGISIGEVEDFEDEEVLDVRGTR